MFLKRSICLFTTINFIVRVIVKTESDKKMWRFGERTAKDIASTADKKYIRARKKNSVS